MPRQVIRDNFDLYTWLAFGCVLQALISFALPPRYALLPVAAYLSHRLLYTILACLGLARYAQMDHVLPGKYTAQIPGRDGTPAQSPSEHDIAILILAARSNQWVLPICATGQLVANI